MSGDIGNAYVNAFTKEKIWSNSGLIFPDHIGKKVIIRKALYGLKSSAHAFYQHLADTLRSMGFQVSRMDASIWYKINPEGNGYDYIAHHVDNFLIVADDPDIYLNQLKDIYTIRGDEIPKLYLGQNTNPLIDRLGGVEVLNIISNNV